MTIAKEIKIEGKAATRQVWINGFEINPERSQKVWNHSPDGFNWGYGGSGPAQLSLAILLEFFPKEIAIDAHQRFKFFYISSLEMEKDFTVRLNRDWLKMKVMEMANRRFFNEGGGNGQS